MNATRNLEPLIGAETTLAAAKAALRIGLKPVPIRAIGETYRGKGDRPKVGTGKEPIGFAWGKKAWTESGLDREYGQNPQRNIGLLMGPVGGIIDIEMDRPKDMDPETFDRLADEELAALCGGEIPETVGWRSHLGVHRIFLWDDRFSGHDEVSNAFKIGRMEIRLGVDGQTQSVIPPSRHASGERFWLPDCKVISPLPDVAIERIVEAAREAARKKAKDSRPAAVTVPVDLSEVMTRRLVGKARKLGENILKANKGDTNDGRHHTALKAARTMGGHIAAHGRDDLIPAITGILIESYRQSKPELDPGDLEFTSCIDDGLRNGYADPLPLDERPVPGQKSQLLALDPVERKPERFYGGRDYFDPYVIAMEYVCHEEDDNGSAIAFCAGAPYAYTGGVYLQLCEEELEAEIVEFANGWMKRHHEFEKKDGGDDKSSPGPVRKVTRALIADVKMHVMSIGAKLGVTTFPNWAESAPAGWTAANTVNCANGLLNVDSLEFIPHTPDFMSLSKSAAAWKGPNAKCPTFDKWLGEVLPGNDDEAKNARENLLAFMGFLLVPDRSIHKGLSIVGEKRTGKGTVLRLISKLVGEENVTNTSLTEISGRFGLEPLLGRLVAMISDARPGKSGSDLSDGAERLLKITGGDSVSVDRKGRSALPSVRLPVRFVMASNGHFNMPEPNAVLPSRWITIRFDVSFYGKEDPGIEDRMESELPGILSRCVEAYRAMRNRGRFHELESTKEAQAISERLAQPLVGFLDEVFEVSTEATPILLDDVYDGYVGWNAENCPGAKPMSKNRFMGEIGSCKAGVKVMRPQDNGKRQRVVVGIKPLDPALWKSTGQMGRDYVAKHSGSGPNIPR